MATIAELIGCEIEEPEPPATFACPRCGVRIRADAVWEPLAPTPGRLRAFRQVHERWDGTTCLLFAGGPLPEGGQDR